MINEDQDIDPNNPDGMFLPSDRRKFNVNNPADVIAHAKAVREFEARNYKLELKKHVDGPMLVTRDGHCYWPSLWERFKIKMGWLKLEDLELAVRRNPYRGMKW